MKSRWERFLDTLTEERQAEVSRLLSQYPESTQEMIRRYPPGSILKTEDGFLYVLHYIRQGEENFVMFTNKTPGGDLDGIIEERFLFSASEMLELEKELIALERLN